jgi:hypothetical protein
LSFDFSGYQGEDAAYGNQQDAAAPTLERSGGRRELFFVAVIVVVGRHVGLYFVDLHFVDLYFVELYFVEL